MPSVSTGTRPLNGRISVALLPNSHQHQCFLTPVGLTCYVSRCHERIRRHNSCRRNRKDRRALFSSHSRGGNPRRTRLCCARRPIAVSRFSRAGCLQRTGSPAQRDARAVTRQIDRTRSVAERELKGRAGRSVDRPIANRLGYLLRLDRRRIALRRLASAATADRAHAHAGNHQRDCRPDVVDRRLSHVAACD